MANRLFINQQNRKSKISQKNKTKKESADKLLDPSTLEKVSELEAKLAHLTKILSDGRKHAGLELQAATTKKRLAKAKEMCKINTLIKKSMLPDNRQDSDAVKVKSKNNCIKSVSQEYGNYYSMRSNILHMEVHQQEIIEAKGLQGFLTEYQNKLAKCFKFEQNQKVEDLFATNRINKLSEKTAVNAKAMKAKESDESMSEVIMEKDLETLVSTNSSCSSQLNEYVDVPSETNFLNEFLKDKVLVYLSAATSSLRDSHSSMFPFDIRNVAESVSDSRLEHLMTLKTKINQSAVSVKENFQNLKSNKFRGKCTDIIPIKNARAMTDIKKVIL